MLSTFKRFRGNKAYFIDFKDLVYCHQSDTHFDSPFFCVALHFWQLLWLKFWKLLCQRNKFMISFNEKFLKIDFVSTAIIQFIEWDYMQATKLKHINPIDDSFNWIFRLASVCISREILFDWKMNVTNRVFTHRQFLAFWRKNGFSFHNF